MLGGTLVASAIAVGSAMPAQAAGFTTFGFDTHFEGNDPTRDIWLKGVTKDNGMGISQFELVNSAVIRENTISTGSQLGPGSSDAGDNASGTVNELPNNLDVVASLGNLNLNNIIDTEDKKGKSVFDIFFTQSANSFFFFERGLNSDLHVEALDAAGNLIAGIDAFEITRDRWGQAGYSIDTTEIGAAQNVGSFGMKFNQNIAGLRVSSFGIADNGPDYKVVAAKTPEPATAAALGLVAGSMLLMRRRMRRA